MPQHFNYYIPTGTLQASSSTTVDIGDYVIGPGIPPGTTVINIINIGNYILIELSQAPWTSNIVPDGIVNNGSGIEEYQGYYSTVIFRKNQLSVPLAPSKTLSFKEDTKGWVSFKSFTPENAISMANDYYTFFNGNLYKHHVENVNRNTFYAEDDSIEDPFTSSSVNVVLNDGPSNIKEFNTLNYEGSQSKVERFTFVSITDPDYVPIPFQPNTDYSDQEYYNLSAKDGWYVESIITNEEDGHIDEFLEKEGKWFNYIKREVDLTLNKADTGDFSFQGIGFVEYSVSDGNGEEVEREGMVGISGCTDRSATNFDPLATVDDGSCIYGKTEEEGEREEEGEGEGEDSTDTDTPTVGEGEEGREEGGGNGEDLDYR